jgi:hypothetical protein
VRIKEPGACAIGGRIPWVGSVSPDRRSLRG